MHELSLAMALVEQVEQVARAQQATAVVRVEVLVGPLSGVHVEALQAAWQMARQDGTAAQATLQVHLEPITVHCDTCGHSGTASLEDLRCPSCASDAIVIRGGRSFVLQSMEIT